MDPRRYEELKASGRLPSPGGVALSIIKLLQQDDYRIEDVSHLVQSDPAIAGCILKFANGVALRQGRPIVSLPKAVFALGAFRVRDLVLGFSLLQSGSGASCGTFDLDRFWSRSLATAIANQELAFYVQIASEENFTLGLLSGVGELSMAALFPDAYGEIAARAADLDELVSLEREFFDIDHREICAALLAEWGLPEVLVSAAFFHEELDAAGFSEGLRTQLLTLSLHFARKLAEICLASEQMRWGMLSSLVTVGARLGIGSDDLTRLADRIVASWQEWGHTLKIQTRSLPPFSEILASAPPIFQEKRKGALGPDASQARTKVLLIGQDHDGAAGFASLLDSAEWEISEARSCEEGLLCALRESPRIAVCDLDLPPEGAAQFCRRIRENAALRDVFIIVVAPGEEGLRLNQAFEAGADDFLTQPLSEHAILMRLRNAQSMLLLREEIRRERRGLVNSADNWAKGRRKLLQSAMTDPLTRLPNRRHGEDFLSLEWTTARHCGRPLACLMLDIDFFKRINDKYGHGGGDAVICQLVSLVKGCLRSEDLAFRYGGEEFVVICPGANLQTAASMGERIRHAVEIASFSLGEGDIPVTVSIGVGVQHAGHETYEDLLNDADRALYLAKQSGRNRVEVFSG